MSDLDPWSITRASPKELLTNIETKSDRKIIRIWNMAGMPNSKSLFEELPQILNEQTELTYLDLSDISLDESSIQILCQILTNKPKLEVLNLSFNQLNDKAITEISIQFKYLTNLRDLILMSNQITSKGVHSIAENLFTCFHLTELILDYNSIDYLSTLTIAELLKFKNTLKRLSLYSTQITDNALNAICSALKSNSSLRILDLRCNFLTAACFEPLKQSLMINTTLTHLLLASNQLGFIENTSSPISNPIKEYSNLTLRHLSILLLHNHTLCHIDLSRNQIVNGIENELFESLKTNLTLSTLNFDGDKLSKVYIDRFNELLNCNRLKKPKSINDLSLINLGLNYIPNSVFHLNSLQKLDLEGNELFYLPINLTNLQNLIDLNLKRNNFRKIPIILMKMNRLTNLYLQQNPLSISFERNLCEESNFNRIKSYLLENETKKIKWLECRMFVVGQSKVGKSTLIRKLRELDTNPTSTSTGIEISSIFRKINNHKYVLNIWDCIDMEIYYGNDLMFFSNWGIYLIVWNVLDAASVVKIDYWLRSILFLRSKATNSTRKLSIVITATHVNSTSTEKAYSAFMLVLKKTFEKLFDKRDSLISIRFIAVDSISNRNIDNLRDLLFDLCSEQVESVFGSYSFVSNTITDLKSKSLNIDQITKHFCKFSEIQENLFDLSIANQNQLVVVLTFFHDIGRLLYFNRNSSSSLSSKSFQSNQSTSDSIVILDCKWFIESIDLIVNQQSRICSSECEILQSFLINSCWNDSIKYPPFIQTYLLDLFSNQDILLRIETENQFLSKSQLTSTNEIRFLVPLLLSFEKPNLDKWLKFNRHFKFHREFRLESIPIGFIGRLIVQLLSRFVVVQRWKFGLLGLSRKFNSEVIVLVELFSTIHDSSTTDEWENVDFESPRMNAIRLFVEGTQQNLVTHFLRYIIQVIEGLIIDWYNLKLEHFVLYYSTINRKRYLIEVKSILKCLTEESNQEIYLNDGEKINLIDVIPDLMFNDFNNQKVNPTDIILEDIIGHGASGIVFSAQWHQQKVAVKFFELNSKFDSNELTVSTHQLTDEEIFHDFGKEAILMISLRHPRIISCFGIGIGEFPVNLLNDQINLTPNRSSNQFEKKKGLFLISEYMDSGNLQDYILDPFNFRHIITNLINLIEKFNLETSLYGSGNRSGTTEKQIEELIQKFTDIHETIISKAIQSALNPSIELEIKPFLESIHTFKQEQTAQNHQRLIDHSVQLKQTYTSNYLPKFSKNQVLEIALEIGKGLRYLHSRNPPIIHRDLKPENILLTTKSTYLLKENHLNFKIADLGLACSLHQSHLKNSERTFGTIRYMANEIMKHEPYSTSSDIYSFALICWQLVNRGLCPYEKYTGAFANEHIIEAVTTGSRPPISLDNLEPWLKSYYQLIRECWDVDPVKRPSIVQVINRLHAIHDPDSIVQSGSFDLLRESHMVEIQQDPDDQLDLISLQKEQFRVVDQIDIDIRPNSIAILNSPVRHGIGRLWCCGSLGKLVVVDSFEGKILNLHRITHEKIDGISITQLLAINDQTDNVWMGFKDGMILIAKTIHSTSFDSTLTGQLMVKEGLWGKWNVYRFELKDRRLIYFDSNDRCIGELIPNRSVDQPAHINQPLLKRITLNVTCEGSTKEFRFRTLPTIPMNEQEMILTNWAKEINLVTRGYDCQRLEIVRELSPQRTKHTLIGIQCMQYDGVGRVWTSGAEPFIQVWSSEAETLELQMTIELQTAILIEDYIRSSSDSESELTTTLGTEFELFREVVVCMRPLVKLNLMILGMERHIVVIMIDNPSMKPIVVTKVSQITEVVQITEESVLVIERDRSSSHRIKFERIDKQIKVKVIKIRNIWPRKLDSWISSANTDRKLIWVGDSEGKLWWAKIPQDDEDTLNWQTNDDSERDGHHDRISWIAYNNGWLWTAAWDSQLLLWR